MDNIITQRELELLADTRTRDIYQNNVDLKDDYNMIYETIEKVKLIGELICKDQNMSYRAARNIPFNRNIHVHNIWIKIWYDNYSYCKDRVFYTLGLFKPENEDKYILLLRMDYKHTGDYQPSENILEKKRQFEFKWDLNTLLNTSLEDIAKKSRELILEDDWKKSFQEFATAVDNEIMLEDIINKVLHNYNIILTGAPGTGKTYLAKEIAANIVSNNKSFDDLSDAERGQIVFVQFHPSYDYTDFVEGLRSYNADKQIGFRRQDGVFKEFCKKALKEWNSCHLKIENSIKDKSILEDKIDAIVNAIIKKGDSFELNNDVDLSECKGTGNSDNSKNLQKVVDIATTKFEKKYVLIIDEINRGELSKIFGELFYSIDPGYRGEKGKVKTQYQNLVDFERDHNGKIVKDKGNDKEDLFKDGFFVPENVYIIGTMNDIDRSVEPMDFAVRRRFVWIDVKPEDRIAMWDRTRPWATEAKTKMNNINAVIRSIEALGEPYCIGPAYFNNPPLDGDVIDNELWNLRLEPILQEYVRILPKEEAKDYMATFQNAFNAEKETKKTDYEALKKDFAKNGQE